MLNIRFSLFICFFVTPVKQCFVKLLMALFMIDSLRDIFPLHFVCHICFYHDLEGQVSETFIGRTAHLINFRVFHGDILILFCMSLI